VQYLYNKSFSPCLYRYINVRLAVRGETQRKGSVLFNDALSTAKLIGAQCHWFVNEARVWSNGRMTVTGESVVRNPTIVGTVQEDKHPFLLASRAQLAVRALSTYLRDKYSI
jgi:hypothetical protein